MKYFIFIFIFLPLIEIYFFVKIGTEIGPVSTILFTLLTAFIGIATLKYQGLTSFMQARQSMLSTKQPGIEILSNIVLFICGVFLLIPGFFTDLIGIILLVPIFRVFLVKFFIKKAFSKFNNSPRNKKQNTDYIDMDPDN